MLGSTTRYTDGSGRKLDTNVLPKDMFQHMISNRAYPSTTEHWQLAVAGEASPYKGNVVVSGAGVVGLATASLFATRGWHVTVVDKRSDPCDEESTKLASHVASAHSMESALLTRRAVDVLGYGGVPLHEIRHLGVKVIGAMDHPGAYNTWFTKGLTERHRFAVNMLAMDLHGLRRHLSESIKAIPSENCKVFYDHKVCAVLPAQKKLVVKPLRDFDKEGAPTVQLDENPFETSLSVNLRQIEEPVEGISYDMIVCAEGANSSLRDYLDVEGFACDKSFGIRWYEVKSKNLDREHVHRWLWERPAHLPVNLAEMNSACQVPMCMAFPQVEENTFALMAYFPIDELERLSPEEMLKQFCPDVEGSIECRSLQTVPHPTIHCEELFNSVGLPNAVMVGDAAHACHPFLMQGLAIGLEDSCVLLNQCDALSRHFYDAVRQYSRERGVAGDSLRVVTERCLYYQRRKHVSPLIRFRNAYHRKMHALMPASYNEHYGTGTNHFYSKSIESMLNGRGYASYQHIDLQQTKHRAYFHFSRLYT